MVVPEIKLSSVAMQMGFTDVMIDAVDPTLEDREEIFDRVGMPEVGTDIFLGAVIDGAVGRRTFRRSLDRPSSRRSLGNLPW